MASRFAITEADLVPDHLPETQWNQLRTDPATDEVVSALEIVEPAENLFVAECGGLFATAANLALAKPHVLLVVIWQAHYRRAAGNSDYKIPEDVGKAKDAAMAWARSTGQVLLAREGNVDPPGRGSVEYEAPTPKFRTTQLDYL
ncbi:MAG: hypothetical protein WC977_03915 [Anaerovoracaceae bacterium]|jgi:hypothetical protein